MHIFKKISSSLWRHISSKQSDTLAVRKDLITLKTKKKYWPRRLEVWDQRWALVPLIHGFSKKVRSHGFKKKDDISFAKEFIVDVRVPTSYGSSLRRNFIADDHLSGLKSHDHLNLLRVRIMSKAWFYYFLY